MTKIIRREKTLSAAVVFRRSGRRSTLRGQKMLGFIHSEEHAKSRHSNRLGVLMGHLDATCGRRLTAL
ncbi:MAG: hypothetical protein KAX95_07910 [Pseudomonas sp.]|nr:hypothetical protein [Pseudomonas sp.]